METYDSCLLLGAIYLFGLIFRAEEEGGGLQLVKVQSIGELKRLLSELFVDLVLVVADLDGP